MATACSFPGPVEPDFFERSPDGQWTASSFDYYPPIRMQVARADGSAVTQTSSGS
jgi:hypothetical protein